MLCGAATGDRVHGVSAAATAHDGPQRVPEPLQLLPLFIEFAVAEFTVSDYLHLRAVQRDEAETLHQTRLPVGHGDASSI